MTTRKEKEFQVCLHCYDWSPGRENATFSHLILPPHYPLDLGKEPGILSESCLIENVGLDVESEQGLRS